MRVLLVTLILFLLRLIGILAVALACLPDAAARWIEITLDSVIILTFHSCCPHFGHTFKAHMPTHFHSQIHLKSSAHFPISPNSQCVHIPNSPCSSHLPTLWACGHKDAIVGATHVGHSHCFAVIIQRIQCVSVHLLGHRAAQAARCNHKCCMLRPGAGCCQHS